MEISFTRFRVYLECPWKYKLMFVDGRKIPPTPASSLGLSLHRALEDFHRASGETLDELTHCLDRQWLREGFPDPETERAWLAKGRRWLARYHELEKERRTKIVGVEREFCYRLGRHEVRGMIDRVDLLPDGSHEIIDYKAGASGKPDQQLRFYALGARESWGYRPTVLTTYRLAAGEKVSVPYDGSGEEELKDLIIRTADRIESGGFAPDTSFCPRCSWRKTCAYSVARE